MNDKDMVVTKGVITIMNTLTEELQGEMVLVPIEVLTKSLLMVIGSSMDRNSAEVGELLLSSTNKDLKLVVTYTGDTNDNN